MNLITNMLKRVLVIDFTIRLSLGTGIFWAAVAALLAVCNQALLFLGLPLPAGLDYGHLRPIFTTVLLFGSLLCLFSGISYHIVRKIAGEIKLAPLAFGAFKLHQLAVLLTIVTILIGYNKGREYGEFSWIADALFSLGTLLMLVALVAAIKVSGKRAPETDVLLVAVAGLFMIHLVGNFNLPYGPLNSTPIFTGVHDQATQEVYRVGLLMYLIVLPVLAVLYHFVPAYYGVSLYSEDLSRFVLLASILVVPFAGAAGLVHSAAPVGLQTLGMFAGFALAVATIGGALNVHYSISRSGKRFQSDATGLAFRWAVAFLIALAIVRGLSGIRFVQAAIGYTWLDPKNIAEDALGYGILVMVVGALVVVRRNGGRQPGGLVQRAVFLAVVGILLMIVANVAHGLIQNAVRSAMTDQAELVHTDWTGVLFGGRFYSVAEPDGVSLYMLSLRSVYFAGLLAHALGILLLALEFALQALKPAGGGDYKEPVLHGETVAIAPAGAAH